MGGVGFYKAGPAGVLLFVAAGEGTCIHEGRLGWAAFFTLHFQNPQTFYIHSPAGEATGGHSESMFGKDPSLRGFMWQSSQ